MMRHVATAVGLALTVSSGRSFLPHTHPAFSRSSTTTPLSTSGGAVAAQQPSHREECVGPLLASNGFLDLSTFQPILENLRGFFDTDGDVTLPQDPNADPAARQRQLKVKQKLYFWSNQRIPYLPYLDTPFEEGFPPPAEHATNEWKSAAAKSIIKVLLGTSRSIFGLSEVTQALSGPRFFKDFLARLNQADTTANGYDTAQNVEDFNDLYKLPIATPEASYDFEDDDAFARLRLQGHNCVVMKKCTSEVKAKLKALETDGYETLRAKVESLYTEGKLFVVDHDALAGLTSDALDDAVDRYLMPSIALFEMVDDEFLPIKPIGIQLDQGNAETPSPIFTPDDDPYLWKIAKACFEAGDFTIHEVVSHLSQTHLVMEGPMTAMNRQLPSQHPINVLLRPHTEGTALINWGAQSSLITKGGGVDRICAVKMDDAYDLIQQVTLDRMSEDFTPMKDLEDRQMTTEDFPGRYPYRDHGIKYYDAIFTWVSEYIDIYYTTEDNVTNDYELQNFIDELVDPGLMLVADKVRTETDKIFELKQLLASMIYTASCLHAAVNFPQRPTMTYVPMTPGSVYQAAPIDKNSRTEDEYLDYLPPLGISRTQIGLLTFLADVYYTQIGEYDAAHFTDERVAQPLAKFKENLSAIKSDLETENNEVVEEFKNRDKGTKSAKNFAYETLLPDAVPQSINI